MSPLLVPSVACVLGALALAVPLSPVLGAAPAASEERARPGGALATARPSPAQDSGTVATEDEVVAPTPAPPEVLERLLARYEDAADEGDALKVAAVLGEMAAYTNPELLDVAKDALDYQAGDADEAFAEREAEELGLRGREALEQLEREREERAQIAAANLLANFPDAKTGALLLRAMKDKELRKEKPKVMAAVIETLGRIRYERATGEIEGHLKRFDDKHVMRACVRYFGWIETRDKGVVRLLCEQLDPPEPADPNSPSNPPASYWAARWEIWDFVRRDVSWALKRITGQVFQPAEGQAKGDSQKALEWIREHERELGLR